MWDNLSTQQYAVMDYPQCHRKMERAAIVGGQPF
jgi:taurine dioxygenase